MTKGEAIDMLEKSGKDVSKLRQRQKASETDKYIGKGTLPRGIKAVSSDDKEYTIKRDVEMSFTKKVDGKMMFEHKGEEYTVTAKDVSDFERNDEHPDFKQKKSEKNDDQKKDDEEGTLKKKVEKADKESENDNDGDFVYKKYIANSLGKKRSEMPQFDEENLIDVIVHFSDKAKIKKVTKALKSLKFAQGEINEDKVLKRIKEKSTNWKDRKYIISLDNYILDGHHDASHGLEVDPDYEVDCYRISLPIKNLLNSANKLKIAKKEDVDGKKLNK